MSFRAVRRKNDQDIFGVPDDAQADQVSHSLCPGPDDELDRAGAVSEMGKSRAAFAETLAMNSIGSRGYCRCEAKTFNPVAEWPLAMP